ncbi:MAG TPA: cobaltochelatase subunit CobN, partial [Stellaceae bacterium]|nr:cobaltochelatase subunit CobN [Stellaceae bacterium]
MHLLAAEPGTVSDGAAAVDLGQSAGDIVVLTAADTEIACLAAAQGKLAEEDAKRPTLRLANLLRLRHNLSVDLYADGVIARARLVVARLLGGRSYWAYGIDRLVETCRDKAIPLALLPGDEREDAELKQLSTLDPAARERLWRYLSEGGTGNAENFLRFAASLLGREESWREPQPLLRAGLYWPGVAQPGLDDVRRHWQAEAPVAAVIFYRALVQAADTAPVDALIAALAARGLNPLPLFAQSLRDPQAQAILAAALAEAPPEIVLNATGFAVASPGGAPVPSPFAPYDCPVLQAILAGGDASRWRASTRGLDARDVAMSVALPEVDGRIVTRAISFKGEARRDPLTEADLVRHVPVADRVEFVAALAANWVKLRRTAPAERRVALVLANYPNKNGRVGNGVGLDTPASVVAILRALADAGYRVADIPADGEVLMQLLLAGPTNAASHLGREGGEEIGRNDYAAWFASLPMAAQNRVAERWGPPESDPFFRPSDLDCGRFAVPALRFGNVVVAIQPARGYNLDPVQAQHDPALVPPHGYLAFHAWLADGFRAQAVVHVGKHGNLEWLPGKALALSAECFPEAALGPLPNLYPFIVNDPGEGTQAKRRTQAVIVDHLTPPLTRAGSHGPQAELERLVDEYFEAATGDARRVMMLARRILELARASGVAADCGIDPGDVLEAALPKLDAYLCELKERQIRGGLHVLGSSPSGEAALDLLLALARLPRGPAPEQASLLRALAADLALGFDPLDADLGAPWEGPRPKALAGEPPWRSIGDTVDRLEALARRLVDISLSGSLSLSPEGRGISDSEWPATAPVLREIRDRLAPALAACGGAEMQALLAGLAGRFVAPGPSGAPSRGRPEVLPTGRNFYSVDTRALPTPAAWALGWKSAALLVERHAQDHGSYPRRMALSAWGTSNMRTGGDDIAQALALMGVQPRWETSTGRVVGFEVLPASVLDRPRVDVTLRVSGFFRDAFANLIDLVDSAARAVAALEESPEVNPLAARVAADTAAFTAKGMAPAAAARRAGTRVFGSKPGAYGAGLQALIDERLWKDDGDLAEAYLAWGSYAYGGGLEGREDRESLRQRLGAIEAVVQNQDNHEHDILDSDDYYQFEGGLAATARHLSGTAPSVYHNDHSRPERPQIRALEDEIGRVVRARVTNPKWIAAMMRHGYKGGFEMAATVDYLFAFAATARAVKNHHFDAVHAAFLGDAAVREFLARHNPAALAEMADRFAEAIDRGLWKPARNSLGAELAELKRVARP